MTDGMRIPIDPTPGGSASTRLVDDRDPRPRSPAHPRQEIAAVTRSRSTAGPRQPGFERLAQGMHDERARQAFVVRLRRYVTTDLAAAMRRTYEMDVVPTFTATHGRAPWDGNEVRAAMGSERLFRAFRGLRGATQELTWSSVEPQVARTRDALLIEARRLASVRSAGGRLRLDPDLPLPREVMRHARHLELRAAPEDDAAEDVAPGAVHALATSLAAAASERPSRSGSVAASIARWLRWRQPAFAPRRIVDLGCSTGSNLLPYLQMYPDAEAHGIDVSAPLLRYAHAVAESRGLRVHYSQQDAANLDFPDQSVDLICSSSFLQQQPERAIARILREAHRILRPGGLMVHMAPPPTAETSAFDSFLLDLEAGSDGEIVKAFRRLDLNDLCAGAGFAKSRYFATRIPVWGTVSSEVFRDIAVGQRPAPRHDEGASWFVFGAVR